MASNGPLDGLLSSPLPTTYDPSPILLAQATNPPTAGDLAETIEVQFTPEITAKALELENNPLKIYNWVRNNIEFVPTYGSIQGANYCLQTKLCNAFDTASLLIALLRVSNIPARYVEGTVEIPIEKVKNWAGGFTDSMEAINLLASAGIPTTGNIVGGEIKSAWMTMATFSVHLPVVNITATIDFDPNTLNKKSKGKWVVVYIELPEGYNVADIIISSILLEGTIPAEPWPYNIGDEDKDGIPDLMVKFKRSDVIAILPNGDDVIINVTGQVGDVTFEGFDIIRVIN